jgi:hypothetical protein
LGAEEADRLGREALLGAVQPRLAPFVVDAGDEGRLIVRRQYPPDQSQTPAAPAGLQGNEQGQRAERARHGEAESWRHTAVAMSDYRERVARRPLPGGVCASRMLGGRDPRGLCAVHGGIGLVRR